MDIKPIVKRDKETGYWHSGCALLNTDGTEYTRKIFTDIPLVNRQTAMKYAKMECLDFSDTLRGITI